MAQTLFTNCRIFDGSSKRTSAGEVLLQGNRIQKVGNGKGGKIKIKPATPRSSIAPARRSCRD